MTYIALFLFVGVQLWTCAQIAPSKTGQQFYRLQGIDAQISGFDRAGVLHWSGGIPGEAFLVEKTSDLLLRQWIPHARGITESDATSVKIEHFGARQGFVFIPGGQFNMGDSFNESAIATPVHSVEITPFFMKAHEISNRELKEVYQWAYDQGMIWVTNGTVVAHPAGTVLLGLEEYAAEISFRDGLFHILPGKENHPCVYVSWYGSAAYCNFRSNMEGKEECYDVTDWTCDINKPGYRLPTEAEWEYAARGAFVGRRFPWPDTDEITHSRANYRSSTNYVYDVSSTRGFHPNYAIQPLRTSPVGAFPPNSYGLYDMAGNVWEWVGDWGGRYSSTLQLDPTGPATGVHKVFRGGSNYTTAERCTCAVRYTSTVPSKVGYDTGFRIVTRAAP